MSPFADAVNRLASSATGSAPVEELHDFLSILADRLETSSAKDRDEALGILAEAIVRGELSRAALLALGCGAIVEHGGDPNLALDAILTRMPDALKQAKAYRDVCRAAESKEAIKRGGEPPKFFFHEPTNSAQSDSNDPSLIWDTLDSLGRGVNAILARSVDARTRARSLTEIRRLTADLADDYEQAGYLAELLDVLDDEMLLVMHPELMLGYWVRIRGVADNFQLHTLLADVLIGDPFEGWIPGVRPDPRVAAAARDGPPVPDLLAEARFNLVGWRGLQPDGLLPTGLDGSEYWIWGEGVPADIEPFQGTRVILLGPPPYPRDWAAERRFDGMHAEIEVLEKLPFDSVRDRLARIARSEH
jgi:hypothetical protein